MTTLLEEFRAQGEPDISVEPGKRKSRATGKPPGNPWMKRPTRSAWDKTLPDYNGDSQPEGLPEGVPNLRAYGYEYLVRYALQFMEFNYDELRQFVEEAIAWDKAREERKRAEQIADLEKKLAELKGLTLPTPTVEPVTPAVEASTPTDNAIAPTEPEPVSAGDDESPTESGKGQTVSKSPLNRSSRKAA